MVDTSLANLSYSRPRKPHSLEMRDFQTLHCIHFIVVLHLLDNILIHLVLVSGTGTSQGHGQQSPQTVFGLILKARQIIFVPTQHWLQHVVSFQDLVVAIQKVEYAILDSAGPWFAGTRIIAIHAVSQQQGLYVLVVE